MKKGIVGVGLAVALTGVVAAPAIAPAPAAYAEEAVVEVADATALQSALTEGKSVKLTANITGSVTVPAGKSVTIDLNSYTLTATKQWAAITNNGTLVVKGTGTVDGSNLGGTGALYNAPGATATLEGGTFTGSTWYVIKNLGKLTIDGATIDQKDAGSSAIDNGYYGNVGNDCGESSPASGSTVESVGVSLNIKSGTFTGGMNVVKNDDYAKLEISGGSFSNTVGPAVLNWSEAEISGGDFSVSDKASAVISNGSYGNEADKGELTITGGTFTASHSGTGAVLGCGSGGKDGGSIAFNGGEFKGDFSAAKTLGITATFGEGVEFSNLNTLVSAAKYLSDDMAVETTDGETFTVKTADNAEKNSSYVISASMKSDNTKLNIYFSGENAQKNAEEFIGGSTEENSPVGKIDPEKDVKVVTYNLYVEYDTAGGEDLGPTVFDFTNEDVKDGKYVLPGNELAPTATRRGYVFNGWLVVEYDKGGEETGTTPLSDYLDDNGDLKVDVTSDEMTKDANYYLTLRATWTYGTYTVNFDSNGGTEVSPVELTVDDEGVATLDEDSLPAAPTREGYKFVGWQEKNSDGVWETVEYPDLFTAGDTAEESTTTLKAAWLTDHVVINFDSNGGSAVDQVVLKTNDKNFASFSKDNLPKNPTREGYTFAGWQIYTMVDEDGTLAWVDADLTDVKFGASETEEGATFTVRAAWTRNDESDVKKDDKSDKKALPKTGDASMIAAVAAGLAGLSAAGAGLVTKRRNK